MKRYILFITWALMLPLVALAQTGGYDPENPPQPNWPEDETQYPMVTVESIPYGVGSFGGDANRRVKPGKATHVYAYDRNESFFVEWKDVEGNTLTTDRTYNFTMPDHDVKFYAIYTYDPANPSNPELIGKYMLSLRSDPQVGGSFNFKDKKVEEGSKQGIRAYTNSGFKFINWTDEEGNVVGTEASMNFLMPGHNTTLTAHFDYAPEAPQEPGTNLWDATSGELIMDFFTPGRLYDAMTTMVGGSGNRDQATSLTVDGTVTNNDWNFPNYFKKLTYIDLSRVEGFKEVPSSRFKDYTDLQEIELPKGVASIGNYAFQGCTGLVRFNCYATTPPTLGKDVFKDVPAEMVVFVPESSVDIYKATAGWNQFDIVPLLSKICTLEVNLPDDYADGRYKNMSLEVINVKSGQRYKYVITDRQNYTFPTLIRKTSYKAYVKNALGQVAGETDVIEIDQEKVSVKFASILVPKTVAMKVMAGGNDITDQVTVKWEDKADNYIATGSKLEGQLKGNEVYYTLTLPESAGRAYVEPGKTAYTIDESNDITVNLTPLPRLTLSNVWKAYYKGLSATISAVTFTVSQLLNGKYTSVVTFTTKGEKVKEVELFDAPTTIVVSAADFIDETYEVKDLKTDFPAKFELKPANGPVINVAFTYQETVDEGVTPEVANFYPDFANVSYTLYNITQAKEITSFMAKYPKITMPDEVKEGDLVRITAKSTTGEFKNVTVSGKVEGNTMSVVIPIVQHGGIKARFLVTDNAAVVGMLFDKKGTLLKHSVYANFNPQALEGTDANDLAFTNLEDGTYTLITMGQSDFFSSMFDLNHFDDAGLQEGVDYLKNVVTVVSGKMTPVRNVVVPVFNESQFYYTGVNTSFAANKANVIQGNYLTFNARLDFNDEVKASVSEVELVFPLPINCDFVNGSLMVGKSIAGEHQFQYTDSRQKTPDPDANGTGFIYSEGEHSLVVQMGDNYAERVKFCVVPIKRGNYTPTAYVRFKLAGKTIVQPIGSAAFTVNDVTIWTPSLISEDYVHVDGNAPAFSEIYIYDDSYMVGYAQALADGYWSADCSLPIVTNLSVHPIWAYIVTPNNIELTSERRFVEYNIKSIQAKEVEMSFFNNAANRTVVVNFDLEHSKASQPSYPFQGGTEFVFTANLTNNSPELVESCTVRVFTNNHEWIELPAQYIPNLDRWVAHSKFDSQTMPIGVRVNVESDYSEEIDLDKLFEYYNQPVINARADSRVKRAAAEAFSMQIEPVGDSQLGSAGQYFQGRLADFDLQTFSADTLAMPTVDGKTVTVYVDQDGSFLVDNPDDEGNVWGVRLNAVSSSRQKVRIATDLNNELKQRIMLLSELGQLIVPYTSRYTLEGYWAMFKKRVEDWTAVPPTTPAAIQQCRYDTNMMNIFEYAMQNNEEITQLSRNINDLLSFARNGLEDVNNWQAFADRILPCNGLDDPQARALAWLSQRNMVKHGWQYISSVEMACNAAQVLLNHLNPSTAYYIVSSASESDLQKYYNYACTLSNYMMMFSTNVYLQNKVASNNHLRKAKRDKNRLVNCSYDLTETIEKKYDPSLPYPIVEPIIDPSGFVYEGVSSNRLEGVTATVFYKRIYEDMYGDLQQEIVKWDAENYGQENPLYTDAEGMYAWDVPQGLWQVKFEKDGYQPTASEWLPVPPPQLDVNIGMTQLVQPEVVKARAFEEGHGTDTDGHGDSGQSAATAAGVEITFSKYMKPDMLNADNIFVKGVKDNEETLLGELLFTCPDLESDIDDSDVKYAKKVFVTTGPLSQYDEVYLIVNQAVESYAGIQMTETYQQKIDIERRIGSISTQQQVSVAVGESTTLAIAALPTEAAAGKKVSVTVASAKVATLNEDQETVEVTLDEGGQASLTINGLLFGTTALQMQVVGEEVTAQTMVNVLNPAMLEPVKAPIASRISGTAVYRGQTVTLSCETEGATIYYTTDGSCPCNSETRQLYQNPIAINQATTLKAMAVGASGLESDVVELSYLIRQSTLTLNLAAGWNWASHDLEAPMPVSELEEIATQVLTPQSLPIEGKLEGAQAVKLQVAEATTKQLSGDQYNPTARSITLSEGWNWLGYPIDQMLTVGDALKHLQAEEGDVITNLVGGFAEYVGGQWKGLLLTMEPGQGYLYKSASEKSFVYNNVPSTNARALRMDNLLSAPSVGAGPVPARNQAGPAPAPHLYPSMMAVTAQLVVGTSVNDATSYTIAAFAGDVCRGVAQAKEGLVYLPVYGNDEAEDIVIKIFDDKGTELKTDEVYTFQFLADVLGSANAPYVLTLPLRGDANRDGRVNDVDIASVISCMAEGPASPQATKADVNDDGSVNIADIITIINLMGGKDK